MLEKTRVTLYLRLVRPLIHVGLILGVFFLTYKLRLVTDLIPGLQLTINPIDIRELQLFAVIAAVTYVIVGFFFGLYNLVKPFRGYQTQSLKTVGLWFVIIAFVGYFGHGLLFDSGISRLILLWSGLLVFVIFSVVDWLRNALIMHYQQYEPYRVLCVYDDKKKLGHIQKKLGTSYYHIVGLSADQWHDIAYDDYDYVIAVGRYKREKIQQEFDKIRLAHHYFLHVTDDLFLDDVVYQSTMIEGVRATAYTPTTLDGRKVVIKRCMDLCLGTLAVVLSFPVMLLLALVITLDSAGPVLYLQKRIGRNGEAFTFVKFRTMYTHLCVGDKYGGEKAWEYKKQLMDSDLNIRKGELQKINNDPRVTRFGRFLRRTSLDELPSLFLVVWGTMSLVGPRPHEVFEVKRYKSWQRRLLSMKPGITGYAQIHGRDRLRFDEEAKYDLYYMQHWSVWLDMYILIMTVKVVFLGR